MAIRDWTRLREENAERELCEVGLERLGAAGRELCEAGLERFGALETAFRGIGAASGLGPR